MTTKVIPHYLLTNLKTGVKTVYKHFSFMCKDNGLTKQSTVRYQVINKGKFSNEEFTVEPVNLIAQSWGNSDSTNLVGNKV